MSESALPLAGIRVVEFVHMVMGATRGSWGSGGLAPMRLPHCKDTLTPLLPLSWDGDRLPKRIDPPQIGEHTVEFSLAPA